MRPLVMVRGDLVGSAQAIHLVEGHTRYGALRGLVEAGVLDEDSPHEIWIGEPVPQPNEDGPWRDVLKRQHVPFLDWLMRQVGRLGKLRIVASRLIDARHASLAPRRVCGDDLAAVPEIAGGDPKLAPRPVGCDPAGPRRRGPLHRCAGMNMSGRHSSHGR